MSSSEPNLSAPDAAGLPVDPVRYRRRGPGIPFWLGVMVIVAVLGVGAGVFGARYLPSFGGDVHAVALQAPLRPSTAAPEAAAIVTPAEVAPAQTAPTSDVASLTARIAELEAGQQKTLEASAAALAATSLIQAAQTSRPFGPELAAVEPLLADTAQLADLRRVAESGAPTAAELAATYPQAAARAIAASRRPDARSSLLDHARHAVGSVMTIRRVDVTEGSSPHAVLARAEIKLGQGDVDGALQDLAALPPSAQEALGEWKVKAQRRADLDRRLASLRDTSLRTLRGAGGPA